MLLLILNIFIQYLLNLFQLFQLNCFFLYELENVIRKKKQKSKHTYFNVIFFQIYLYEYNYLTSVH